MPSSLWSPCLLFLSPSLTISSKLSTIFLFVHRGNLLCSAKQKLHESPNEEMSSLPEDWPRCWLPCTEKPRNLNGYCHYVDTRNHRSSIHLCHHCNCRASYPHHLRLLSIQPKPPSLSNPTAAQPTESGLNTPMTPNMTNQQTIAIGTALADAVLVFFFTALILLTFQEEIRNQLQCWGLLIPARNHYHEQYVLPWYERTLPRAYPSTTTYPCSATNTTTMTATRCWNAHTRATATVSHSSNEEYFESRQTAHTPDVPRNATLGPSNVQRTPSPNAIRETRVVWTEILNGPADPDYPMGTWGPDDTPANLRVWDQPVAPPDVPGFSATDLRIKPKVITIHDTDSEPVPLYLGGPPTLHYPCPWVLIPHPDRLGLGLHMAPRERFPNESDASDIDSPPEEYLTYRQRLIRNHEFNPLEYDHRGRRQTPGDPFYPHWNDYDWPDLSIQDQEILGPEQTAAWDLRWQDLERWLPAAGQRVWEPIGYYLATERGNEITGTPAARQETIMARIFVNQNQELYPPAEGNRVRDARLHTAEEQRGLEDTLRELVARENDRLCNLGRSPQLWPVPVQLPHWLPPVPNAWRHPQLHHAQDRSSPRFTPRKGNQELETTRGISRKRD